MKTPKELRRIDLGILKALNYFMMATVIGAGAMLAILKLCEANIL